MVGWRHADALIADLDPQSATEWDEAARRVIALGGGRLVAA